MYTGYHRENKCREATYRRHWDEGYMRQLFLYLSPPDRPDLHVPMSCYVRMHGHMGQQRSCACCWKRKLASEATVHVFQKML